MGQEVDDLRLFSRCQGLQQLDDHLGAFRFDLGHFFEALGHQFPVFLKAWSNSGPLKSIIPVCLFFLTPLRGLLYTRAPIK